MTKPTDHDMANNSRLILRLTGLALMFCALLAGCLAEDELVDMSLRSNVVDTFPWQVAFECEPNLVYGEFMSLLTESSAMIVARDEANYFVSWIDGETRFRTLQANEPAAPFQMIGGGRIHGSARVYPSGSGRVLRLHCVRRDETDSSVSLSNGGYEQRLTEALERRINKNGAD